MAKFDIKKVQDVLLDMGKSISNIFEQNNISYMLAYGTLLGAVRHKGFIPWDDDFDFYVFDDKYDKAIELLRKYLPRKYFVEDIRSEPLYFHAWAHVKDLNSITKCDEYPQDSLYSHSGISIDLYRTRLLKKEELFDFYNAENRRYLERRKANGMISIEEYTKRLKKQEQVESNANPFAGDDSMIFSSFSVDKKAYMDYSDVLPLRQYDFEDAVFWGPANYDNILKNVYGDYMKLPPVNKRVFHYSSVLFK